MPDKTDLRSTCINIRFEESFNKRSFLGGGAGAAKIQKEPIYNCCEKFEQQLCG